MYKTHFSLPGDPGNTELCALELCVKAVTGVIGHIQLSSSYISCDLLSFIYVLKIFGTLIIYLLFYDNGSYHKRNLQISVLYHV